MLVLYWGGGDSNGGLVIYLFANKGERTEDDF